MVSSKTSKTGSIAKSQSHIRNRGPQRPLSAHLGKVGKRTSNVFPFTELPAELRNAVYRWLKPDHALEVYLTHQPGFRPSRPRRVHPFIGMAQVNRQLRNEFRPFIMAVPHVVALESLGVFMNDFGVAKKESISKIIAELQQDPLPRDGVNIVPLLRFLWNNTSVKIVDKEREYWDLIEVTEFFLRHTYAKPLVSNSLITSITITGEQKRAQVTIQLSNIYNSKCDHEVVKVIKDILRPQGEKTQFESKEGLHVVCNTERVEGRIHDGMASFGYTGWCKFKNTGQGHLGRASGRGALALWTHHPALRLGASVQVRELFEFSLANGLRAVGGSCPTVGAAGGFTQGLGHGPLSSAYGLRADNTLEFDVVTMDGQH